MTQYLLSVHNADDRPLPTLEEMQPIFDAVDEVNQEMQANGVWVFGGGLELPSTATVVAVQGTEVLLTDGPFVEGKEHIGGFWVIDVPDLDAALAWATKATTACQQPVEVRPFQEEPQP
jgi:hypothetical protein